MRDDTKNGCAGPETRPKHRPVNVVERLKNINTHVVDERENSPLRVENGKRQTTDVKNGGKIMITWKFLRFTFTVNANLV